MHLAMAILRRLLSLTPLVLGVMLVLGAAGAQAGFPGQNGRIAFSDADADPGILTMNANGTGLLATGEGSWPSWSADGSEIAFESGGNIWTMNANGTDRTQVTTLGGSWPTWSPDGTKIAFLSTRDNNYEIYRINAGGTGEMNLTNHAMDDGYPAWSPDGTKIAFVSVRDGGSDIFVMNPDGSGPTNLTNGSGINWMPDWSPDGAKIAMHSLRFPTSDDEVWVMNADGTGLVNLTQSPETDRQPVWSPDGTKIAFLRVIEHNFDVYVMNANGTGQADITNTADVSEQRPSWQPIVAPGPVGGISLDPTAGAQRASGFGLGRWRLAGGGTALLFALGVGFGLRRPAIVRR
jgi:Tol biopolymer transport system component